MIIKDGRLIARTIFFTARIFFDTQNVCTMFLSPNAGQAPWLRREVAWSWLHCKMHTQQKNLIKTSDIIMEEKYK